MSRFPENIYERESTELLTVTVQKNKATITSNIFLCVIDSDERPGSDDWEPAIVTTDNKCGILINNLAVGIYTVWVRVVSSPENAIFRVGTVRII